MRKICKIFFVSMFLNIRIGINFYLDLMMVLLVDKMFKNWLF